MGCCVPINREDNIIKSNLNNNIDCPSTSVFINKNNDKYTNNEPKERNKNINNMIESNNNDGNTLKLTKNQPITTNINNINININQI